MKALITILTLCCLPYSLMANTISLDPGSSATIKANQETTVSCSGSNQVDHCSLREHPNNQDICIFYDRVIVQCYHQARAKEAVSDIQCMKRNGSCN